MTQTFSLSFSWSFLSLGLVCAVPLGGCSLLQDVLDPDKNVRDGGSALDSGVQLDAGGTCEPQAPVTDQGLCDAYWESVRWNGSECESVGYSGCGPNPDYFETYERCQAAYRDCDQPAKRCYVGGCSGQLCTDAPGAISTCEWREEYACYQEPFARCEQQQDGECGWTPTEELRECLNDAEPDDCRTTGCPNDQRCEPCWATYACLPPGVVC